MIQSIKKATLHYASCQGGDLHDGQIMNLVCVDERCTHRGLICPICKMQSHEDHYILPIKSFLQQIQEYFLKPHEGEQLSNLGDYLRSLELTKKQLLASIKTQIIDLASIFKQLQIKVEQNYLSMRRNVLIQASLTTKLPMMINLLTNQYHQDAFDLQREFNKYCELIKYQQGKLKISDQAKKIVEVFRTIPQKSRELLVKSIENYKKDIGELNKLMNVESIDKILKKQIQSKFSSQNKSSKIQLNEEKTEATMKQSSQGIIFVDKPFTSLLKSYTFTITHNNSKQIFIGVGDVQKLKTYKFQNNDDLTTMDGFVLSDGTTSQNINQNQYNDSDEDVPSPQLKCFSFNQEKTKINVEYNVQSNRLVFKNVTKSQTFELPLKNKVLDSDNWKLCIGLGNLDSITISSSE